MMDTVAATKIAMTSVDAILEDSNRGGVYTASTLVIVADTSTLVTLGVKMDASTVVVDAFTNPPTCI
jgi:hypothetical protein